MLGFVAVLAAGMASATGYTVSTAFAPIASALHGVSR
jgi:hypothetical protein